MSGKHTSWADLQALWEHMALPQGLRKALSLQKERGREEIKQTNRTKTRAPGDTCLPPRYKYCTERSPACEPRAWERIGMTVRPESRSVSICRCAYVLGS